MSKVSVIIPTYNRSKHIRYAIDSVLNQTYSNFEIIVVDDGSRDNTRNIIETYVDKYKDKIKYIYQNNKGVSSARNNGIRNANGAYLTFLDDDDILLPNMLESEYLLNKYDVIKPSCYKIAYDINGVIVEKKVISRKCINDITNLYAELLRKNILGNPTCLIKKECFNKAGLFNENMAQQEDWEMWIRIARCGYRFYGSDEPLYVYNKFNRRKDNRCILQGIRCSSMLLKLYQKEAMVIDTAYFRKAYSETFWNYARTALYECKNIRWFILCVFKSMSYDLNFKRYYKCFFNSIFKYISHKSTLIKLNNY